MLLLHCSECRSVFLQSVPSASATTAIAAHCPRSSFRRPHFDRSRPKSGEQVIRSKREQWMRESSDLACLPACLTVSGHWVFGGVVFCCFYFFSHLRVGLLILRLVIIWWVQYVGVGRRIWGRRSYRQVCVCFRSWVCGF